MNDARAQTKNGTRPRLWVETLWLLDSLEAKAPLREIELRRGLNLIVSPPGGNSSGHGVGKTAFCQLLRFVLDDVLWSNGSTLRDELLQSRELKDGAVAARVHVGGEVWTVLKPWLHQKNYRASRTLGWQKLAANDGENEFHVYQHALKRHLVEILPIQELPGSKQPIEWHQILAWCSRDQNARYQNYHQWRAEGVGFSLPAKSPAALMQIVLGLLHDASTLRDMGSTIRNLEEYKAKLHSLQDEPARLLKHVYRQLSRRLNASAATPFRQEGLIEHENLIGIARQRHDAYRQELLSIDAERQELAKKRYAWAEMRAPLTSTINLLGNEINQIEAMAAGDMQRVAELQSEAASLQQRLPTRCDAGNRLLKDCSHVMERIEQTQIDRKQSIVKHQRLKEELETELPPLRRRLDEVHAQAVPIDTQLIKIDQRNHALTTRYAQCLSEDQLLSDAIEDYEHYEGIATGNAPSAEIVLVSQKLNSEQRRLDQLQIKLEAERGLVSERRQDIGAAMQAIAKSLPSFQWGVFSDDDKHRNRPFQMGPMHSTTFNVLEILAGDVACVVDSASSESFHPGFLLHDSPREAEMSESMLWALLGHVVSVADDSFQYIVTTSTEPAEQFKDFVRLRLSASSDDGFLLRRRIGVVQTPLA